MDRTGFCNAAMLEPVTAEEAGGDGRTVVGVKITFVRPGSALAGLGVRPGDVVLKLNGRPLSGIGGVSALST